VFLLFCFARVSSSRPLFGIFLASLRHKSTAGMLGAALWATVRAIPARHSRTSLKSIKVAPKYRAPSGETWTGRGAMPRWLAALKKEGHKLEKFLIARPAKTVALQTRGRPSPRRN
jgi:hypothetical protein